MTERRTQIDRAIEAHRHLLERLRDISLPAARQEREQLERTLMQLRTERRNLPQE
jgi:hypothetical protein